MDGRETQVREAEQIDLKNGTTILPTGMTPLQNQRVAVIGYYSNGTFVANRVILRQKPSVACVCRPSPNTGGML